MTGRGFSKDLRRWEEGEITSSLLKARYPRRDVEGLTELFSQIRSLSEEPVADMVPSWNEVRSRMASRRQAPPQTWLQKLQPGLHRRLAMGVAAALLALPPVAFAAGSDTVRDSVGSFFGSVTVFVMGEDTVGGESSDETSSQAGPGTATGTASSGDGGTDSKSTGHGGSGAGTAKGTDGASGSSSSTTGGSGGSAASGTSGASGSEGSGGGATSPASPPGADGASVPGAAATSPPGADPGGTTTETPAPTPSPSPTIASAPQAQP